MVGRKLKTFLNYSLTGARRNAPLVLPLVLGLWLGVLLSGVMAEFKQPKRTIWEDAAIKSPMKYRPHLNLSAQYMNDGRFARSLDESQTAIKIEPSKISGYINAASASMKLGAWQLAYIYTGEVLKRKPIKAAADNYVILCTMLGKKEEADNIRKKIEAGEYKDLKTLDLKD